MPLHLPNLRTMAAIRHHLRALAVVWLLCQSAVLSAFVPMGCCPEQPAAMNASEDCHGADGLCPMHRGVDDGGAADTSHAGHSTTPDTADGHVECPMHQTQGAAPVPCVMRGLCGSPAAAVSLLLPAFAPPEPAFTLPQPLPRAACAHTVHVATTVPLQHDTPPPRL